MINSTLEDQTVRLASLMESLGTPPRAWQELTPDTVPLKLKAEMEFKLGPAGMRIFYNPEGAPLKELPVVSGQ